MAFNSKMVVLSDMPLVGTVSEQGALLFGGDLARDALVAQSSASISTFWWMLIVVEPSSMVAIVTSARSWAAAATYLGENADAVDQMKRAAATSQAHQHTGCTCRMPIQQCIPASKASGCTRLYNLGVKLKC